MTIILKVIASTLIAGLAMPLGATIAHYESIKTEWIKEDLAHQVMAFGAGALLSAVALVLVPEGTENLSPSIAAICFILGGYGFMIFDIILYKMNTPASQLAAMLADFVPESIALGAAFALDSNNAYLLAGLIALQNVPEGYNAYRELQQTAIYKPFKIISLFIAMALLGPIAGLTGYFWLSEFPEMVSAIMLFAAGGILYSIFQDIAPHVKSEKHWGPPMGAVAGFVLGIIGSMLT